MLSKQFSRVVDDRTPPAHDMAAAASRYLLGSTMMTSPDDAKSRAWTTVVTGVNKFYINHDAVYIVAIIA